MTVARDPGPYWVKIQPRRVNGEPFGEPIWVIYFFMVWARDRWMAPGISDPLSPDRFVEIDERRIERGPQPGEIVLRYDDGGDVALSSYSGGAHADGAWAHLTLLFRDGDGKEQVRDYTADGPAHDWAVTGSKGALG